MIKPTMRQARILYHVWRNPAVSMRELASEFEITGKGAYDHLQCLIRKGHLNHPEGRARFLVLTRRGKWFVKTLGKIEGDSEIYERVGFE